MANEKKITDAEVNAARALTSKIIDEYGPRLSGSESAIKTAEDLFQEVKKYAENPRKEKFIFAPKAFFSFFLVLVYTFIISTIIILIKSIQSWIYFAAFISFFGIFYSASQFIFYWGLFDFLFKKTEGYNVIGDITPDNPKDIKQEIIVCGHHDSAPVVNFIKNHTSQYGVRLITGLAFILITEILIIIWAINYAITGLNPFYDIFLKYFGPIGFIFAIDLLFYENKKEASPGAGDNLISSTLSIVIGKKLADAKKAGNNLLKDTRVRVISFGAEEAATKGSQAYSKEHKSEFESIPTYALCPDCIYKMKFLKILTSDQNGTTKCSKDIVEDCARIAKELGYEPEVVSFPFGGGATDAAPLERAGVHTVGLMAMDTTLVRSDLVQHTPKDTIENVDKKNFVSC